MSGHTNHKHTHRETECAHNMVLMQSKGENAKIHQYIERHKSIKIHARVVISMYFLSGWESKTAFTILKMKIFMSKCVTFVDNLSW